VRRGGEARYAPVRQAPGNYFRKALLTTFISLDGEEIVSGYEAHCIRYRLTGMLNNRPPMTSPTLKSFFGL